MEVEVLLSTKINFKTVNRDRGGDHILIKGQSIRFYHHQYICMQHKTSWIYKVNIIRSKGKDTLQYNTIAVQTSTPDCYQCTDQPDRKSTRIHQS